MVITVDKTIDIKKLYTRIEKNKKVKNSSLKKARRKALKAVFWKIKLPKDPLDIQQDMRNE